MELSELQQKIIDNNDSIIFVEAAAASGKTALIVEKIKKELATRNGMVVAFTFTNAAAEEMYERVGKVEDSQLFIGTIHSYCVRLLLSHGISEAIQYCESEWFDKLFQLVKQHPECIKPVYCLICDEMQDCNDSQFEFIFDMIQAKKYFCCYDRRQSIYRWNGAHPEYISDYMNELDATVLTLNENYRNATSILNFAKNLIMVAGYDYRDTSIPMRGVTGKVVTDLEYNPNAIARTFSQMDGGFGNWFILTRTNDQIDEVANALKRAGVPYDTFKRAQLDNKELNKRMKEDTVKVLTIHTAKGLEADNVLVVGARFFSIEERCISYVAATRARNALYWTKPVNRRRLNYGTSNWES
jgi:superfamily I DNA/RNA helicase